MKIYPSSHTIVSEDSVKPKDIPLSCLVTDAVEKEYRLSKIIDKAKTVTLESVMPYELFDRPDPYLFDKSMNRMEVATKMIRSGDNYAYFPADAIEFYPKMFDFRVLLKRNLKYRASMMHDIRVGCMESQGKNIASSFISIFGDPKRRPFAPPLVTVNNGEIKEEGYSNMSIEECDFLLIDSPGGRIGPNGEEIDFDEILDMHTNVWLVVDDYSEIGTAGSLELNANVSTLLKNNMETRYFDLSKKSLPKGELFSNHKIPSHFDNGEYELFKVFAGDATPVIALEKPGKGYVIITKSSFIQNAIENRAVIFEAIMQLYANSYMMTNWHTGWITDFPVDYLPRQERVFGRTHDIFRISDMLDLFLYDSNNSVDIIDVEIMQDDVTLKAVTTDKEIFFQKNTEAKDPTKLGSQRSYYTTRKSVIYYKEESVNRVEMPLEVSFVRSDKGDMLHISDYKSTSLRIDTRGETRLRIPDTGNTDYYICVNNNAVSLIPERLYTKVKHGLHIATVSSSYRSVIKNYDTRTFGGGLAESEKPNYNLLDIAHLQGRPHRLGGTMVIELPLHLKPHDELIQNAVKRHIAAGDHFVLVYE